MTPAPPTPPPLITSNLSPLTSPIPLSTFLALITDPVEHWRDASLMVRVPSMTGRRLWNMQIIDLRDDKFVKVSGAGFNVSCGHDRWVQLDTLQPTQGTP